MAQASDLKRLIIDEYLDLHRELISKKYGSKNIVLMQNGMFFEIYGVENEIEKLGNAKEIAEMLNITLARKNNSIIEINRTNHYIVGFPVAQLEKYANKMTEQFTGPLFGQIDPTNSEDE